MREWLEQLRSKIQLIYLVSKHGETPIIAKIIAMITLGLALSPIDPIPDAIPILGLLDDLIFIPFGFYLVLKLTPDWIKEECQAVLEDEELELPISRITQGIIIMLWLVVIYYLGYYLWFLVI